MSPLASDQLGHSQIFKSITQLSCPFFRMAELREKHLTMTSKKNLLFASATSLLLPISSQANDIEPGKEFYTAIKITTPIVLDGDLSEWTGATVLADPRFSIPKGSGDAGELVNFELYGGDWTGPDDHTSSVQVVYDDDNVYFGFTVTDEYHEHGFNPVWKGDAVQLMIANDARDTQVALYNYALMGIENALGEIKIQHEAGPGGTEAIVTRDAVTKKTTYEIKLPKAALALASLTEGVKFGLGMAINDGDQASPGQKGWGGLGAHSIVFGKSPEETALITLGSAVPNDDAAFLSAISSDFNTFTFRATDQGTSVIDPTTATLVIDGSPATLVSSSAGDGVTDFTHTFSTPYPSGSEHPFTIEVSDTNGATFTETSTFTAVKYATLTPEIKASNIATGKPGFTWRIFQNETYIPNSLAGAEFTLTGASADVEGTPIGPNKASSAGPFGPAIGAPVVLETGLLEFEIPTVINLNVSAGETAGNFGPDEQMPGVPGTESTNGATAEIISYIEFPAGFTTMGVNSDDGFRAQSGLINDPENRLLLGEFDANRGTTETLFIINVLEAGIYPLRAVWENGTGQAHIEIFTLKDDGSKVLLNDVANGGLRTFRSEVGAPFIITSFSRDAEGNLTIVWNSTPGANYSLDFATSLDSEASWSEADDGLSSQGTSSQTELSAQFVNLLTSSNQVFFRIREL